jgi:hypothetical protein
VKRWQNMKLDLASAPLKSGQADITLLNELGAEGWELAAITGNPPISKSRCRSLRLPQVLRRWAIRLRHRHPGGAASEASYARLRQVTRRAHFAHHEGTRVAFS